MDVDEVAGKAVPDPYRWLEGSDPKTGTSLEISAWQEKQHAYAETYLATLPGRSVLERQLKAMLETKVSVPVRRGQRSFFLARAPGQDRSVLMLEDRTSRGDADGTKTTRRVLVDPAQWSQRTDAIGPWSVSRDGRFVAYGVALNGADVSTVRVLDVESGKDSAIDVLPRVVWEAPQWSPDGRLLYYNTLPDLPLSDPSRWLQAVMVRHEIGKPASSDLALSKPSLDGGKLQFGQVSHDGRHFFSTVGITGNADTPVFWKRLDASGDLVLISTGLGVGRHSVIDVVGSRLIMVTTAGAANGRVVTLDLNQRDSGWQVLVPEQSAAVIQGASVIGGRLVVTYARHAASEIWIVPLDASGPPKPLSLPGVGSVLDLDTVTVKGEPDAPEFGFLFSSLSTPPAVYRASVNGGAPILEMQAWDNSPLRPTAFERVEFPSKDGTRVGMFVLRRTDLNPGPRPLLVFA